MGSTQQADIPGNVHRAVLHVSSVASDGNAARYSIFRAPQSIKVTAAYWCPYDANQTGQGTSYRRLSVVDGGTAGTGSDIIASLNITASQASMSMNAISGTATVAAGEVVVFSQVTVGGDKNTETILRAGLVQVEYQLL